ncbi:MAG: hypothetical protein LBC29_07155 [Propionibacteriaceae bacterium]|jgi:hypothetical protein|nr:hypothetical protein [Propionibacteriaceae bacterium]
MSIGGMVLGLVAVVWLVCLLPWFLRNNKQEPVDPATADFGEQMRYIRRGQEPLQVVAAAFGSDLEVSTPLLRRAARNQIAAEARTAIRRRRIGFAINFAVLLVTAVLPFFTPITPWIRLVGPLALLGWVVISRASVVIVGKQLRQRMALLERGWEETTVAVELSETAPAPTLAPGDNELSVELSGAITSMPSLLEPVPIASPTYLNRPLLPRSVRVIDLAPPSMWQGVPLATPTTGSKQESLPEDTLNLNTVNINQERAVGE